MKKIFTRFVLIVLLLVPIFAFAAQDGPAPPPATGQVQCYGPVLAQGSDAYAVANLAFTYWINNTLYSKGAVTTGTSPNADVIPVSTYGAWAFDINASGTITAASASANSTGYASAALALAGIPAVVSTKARVGTLTVIDTTSGGFTGGSTSLTAEGVTAAYASAPVIIYPSSSGLTALPYELLLAPITATTVIWVAPISTVTVTTSGAPLSTAGRSWAAINAHHGETWYCISASAALLGVTVH